jgi:uncharacterized membrane protein
MLQGPFAWLWQILYFGGGISMGSADPNVLILYSIVPWIGVMAAGYAFGSVLRRDADVRRVRCLQIGIGAIVLFVVLRSVGVYGDPRPRPPSVLSLMFLNTTKYPASLQFLLMTLGPAIAALPLLEHARGRVAGWLTTFGRVPLFYYLLHIPLIHAVAVAISLVRSPASTGWLFGNHPMAPPPVPPGYMWSLGLLYLVTALVVTTLYVPCRWFAALRARRPDGWLSYL